MTNKEAVIATLQMPGYSENAVLKALEDAGLVAASTYSAANKTLIESVAVTVLQGMLGAASVSEGGYSVSYSIEGVKLRLEQLGAIGATVRAVSIW